MLFTATRPQGSRVDVGGMSVFFRRQTAVCIPFPNVAVFYK